MKFKAQRRGLKLVISFFGTLRPYFRKVVIPKFDGVCSSDLAVIRARKGYDQKFVFYILASQPLIDYADVTSNGTKMPRAKWAVLAKTEWLCPDYPTQQRISATLAAYDDLIEVNNQRIKLLEETARELYKEWFVRMRFPGWQEATFEKGLPVDWEISTIGELIEKDIGGGWGQEVADVKHIVPGYVIRGTDIPKIRRGEPNHEIYRWHKESNLRSRALKPGDVVFENAGGSEGQLLGRTCFITQELLDGYGDEVMAASFCKQIRFKNPYPLYGYFFINSLYETGQIETFQTQSTGISNYQFEPFKKFQQILLPPDGLIKKFSHLVLSLEKQKVLLGMQNIQLRQMRDRLLPRLISGKLKLKEVEALVP